MKYEYSTSEVTRTIAGWLSRGWTVDADPWIPANCVYPCELHGKARLLCSPIALAVVGRIALASHVGPA